MQSKMAAGQIGGHHRWDFQSYKLSAGQSRFAGIQADVCPRKKCAETGYLAGSDPGTHDPESRVGRQKIFRRFVQFSRHQHPGKIRREMDFHHLSEFHIFVFNLGLAGFEPFSGFKRNGDGRAFFR